MPDRREFLRALALGALGAACTSTTGPSINAGSATPTPDGSVDGSPGPDPIDTLPATITPRWTKLDVGGPAARREHTLTASGAEVYLFGGRAGSEVYDDLWVLADGTDWERIDAPGGPSPRFGHNAVAIAGSLIVFGGQRGGDLFDDTYAFDTSTRRWRRLDPPGGGPGIRYGAGAIEHAGAMWISHGFQFTSRYDDTRRLKVGGRWQDRTPSGRLPVERCLHRCAPLLIGDAAHMLLFGGQTDGEPYLGDTWLYDLSQERWHRGEGGGPSARNLYAMTGRGPDAFLFGGFAADGALADTWRFDGEDWLELAPEGGTPPARGGIEGALVDGTMMIFGGDDGDALLSDTWRLRA